MLLSSTWWTQKGFKSAHREHKKSWTHDDVIKWKHFSRYWPFLWGIHRPPVNSPHKGQWRGTLMFSLICALNKRLSYQSGGWWFETPTRSLWRHCNDALPPICWVVFNWNEQRHRGRGFKLKSSKLIIIHKLVTSKSHVMPQCNVSGSHMTHVC